MIQTKFGWKQASGFRGDVVWKCEQTEGRRTMDDGWSVITIAHPEHKLRWTKNVKFDEICLKNAEDMTTTVISQLHKQGFQ